MVKRTNSPSFIVDVNNVTPELMIHKLDMTQEEAEIIIAHRLNFKLLCEDEKALVDLEQLHGVLGQPYGRFDAWFDQKVTPLIENLGDTEISVFREKRKGQTGSTKIKRYVSSDVAKHLAMMTNTEQGFKVRRYFITVEKLARQVCEYNALRTRIEGCAKDVAKSAGLSRYEETKRFDIALSGKAKKRFNEVMALVSGHRNDLETDLDEYSLMQQMVANCIKRGMNQQAILSVLNCQP